MITSLGRLPVNAEPTQPADHLPECDQSHGDWRTCRWCLWAIDIPEVRTLQSLITDAETLLAATGPDTVTWVVAAAELQRCVDSVDLAAIRVRSVGDIAARLDETLRHRLGELGLRLERATSPGGPIEASCLEDNGALAALALQSPAHARTLAELPAGIRNAIGEVNRTLSADTQSAELGRVIDRTQRHDVARLLTQPEWQALPPPGRRCPPATAPAADGSPAPGSLEALVVESVIDDLIGTLTEIGRDLKGLNPPVRFTREHAGELFSSRTRTLVWRRARIDWTLTFIDSGHACCWDTRTAAGSTVTRVPWTVALAIEARKDLGFVSAIRDG